MRAQLELSIRKRPQRRRTHGGRRKGVGRRRVLPGRPRVRHVARPSTNARFPLLITVRMRGDVPRLRRFELCAVLRRAFVHGCRKDGFRICQFSIQGNHVHLVCEAGSPAALAKGMQGWAVRVARGLNRHLHRRGSVFADRYHARSLRTPSETRNALCYVLQNARRHGEALEPQFGGVDAFSSAWWFDGWSDMAWRAGLSPPAERTVAEAESWMLRIGWKRRGLIAVTEMPAAGRARSMPESPELRPHPAGKLATTLPVPAAAHAYVRARARPGRPQN